MLILLWLILVSLAWLILGGLIIDASEVYRPYTRKAKLIHLLIHGPAWWFGMLINALVAIPVWLFKHFSKWVGDKLKKANNDR